MGLLEFKILAKSWRLVCPCKKLEASKMVSITMRIGSQATHTSEFMTAASLVTLHAMTQTSLFIKYYVRVLYITNTPTASTWIHTHWPYVKNSFKMWTPGISISLQELQKIVYLKRFNNLGKANLEKRQDNSWIPTHAKITIWLFPQLDVTFGTLMLL